MVSKSISVIRAGAVIPLSRLPGALDILVSQGLISLHMTKSKLTRELLILFLTLVGIIQAGRSVFTSVERQAFLQRQGIALKIAQAQAQEVNKELREGLMSYRSSKGIERLARERLNLAGQDEIIVRIAK